MENLASTEHSPVSHENLKMRFAVVKLWSELKIKNAEDECIARIKHSAEKLGIECFEIFPDGRYLEDPTRVVCNDDVDFVLHLHYQTPKNYDAFSIVALWNPTQFYVEWDYTRCSRNLLSHDDFFSCGSSPADAMVQRRIKDSPYHLDSFFKFYHSLHDVVHEPGLGEGTLFYAGINWDVLRGTGSRHGDLLKILDTTGVLKIYGPEIFCGVRVWEGYESYQGEIPFDGISMIHEIAKVGISLVLSSQAHKDSEMMSSRLFESVAAGALVIADENFFASRYFGDSLLYIDTRDTPEDTAKRILSHVEWAHKNPEQALEKIFNAQVIFSKNFSHKVRLKLLYDGLSARKASLRAQAQKPEFATLDLKVFFLLPECSQELTTRQISNLRLQDCKDFQPVLCIDTDCSEIERDRLSLLFAGIDVKPKILEIEGLASGVNKVPLGKIFMKIVCEAMDCDAFIIVAPNETLFSNHVFVLKTALEREPEVGCAACSLIIQNGLEECIQISDQIDFGHEDRSAPQGFGRFIFRTSKLPANLDLALPFLHGRPQAALIGANKILQVSPSTLRLNIESEYPERACNEAIENEVIREFHPEVFTVRFGFCPEPRLGPSNPCQSVSPKRKRMPIGRKVEREVKRVFRQLTDLSTRPTNK